MDKRVSCVTFTILTESPVSLSYDQGAGNYNEIKKYHYGNEVYAKTGVSTITYEMRKQLHKNNNWVLSDIVLNKDSKKKVKNVYPTLESYESANEKGLEADVFGYLVPNKQVSKTSPLRIIPFKSIHPYRNDVQLITNKGFLDRDLDRKYFKNDEKSEDVDIPSTQALANEEIFGGYYTWTITIELDRLGVLEVKNGKYLLPDEREYFSKEIREEVLKDILDVVTKLTRDIRHEKVLLKPLVVFGGAFKNTIPYFWNDIILDNENRLDISNPFNTIYSYDLNDEMYIVAVDNRLKLKEDDLNKKPTSRFPVQEIKKLGEILYVGEDNCWYVSEERASKNED